MPNDRILVVWSRLGELDWPWSLERRKPAERVARWVVGTVQDLAAIGRAGAVQAILAMD